MESDAPLSPAAMILWGIPGAGKTKFATWLAENKNYLRVDTDELDPLRIPTRLEAAWIAVVRGAAAGPESFVRAARGTGGPVVAEYGVYACQETIAILGQLQAHGADPWWFDSKPRSAALEAWRDRNRRVAEQRRAGLPAESPMYFADDRPWERVRDRICESWNQLQAFYGASRMLVTVTATAGGGYRHVPPETMYETMNSVLASSTKPGTKWPRVEQSDAD